jgi:hypothetical protein
MTTTYQTGMPRSGVQHRPINSTPTGDIVTPRTTAHPSRVLPRFRPQHPDQALIDKLTRSAPDTDEDTQTAPSLRTGYRQPIMQRFFRWWSPRDWHPAVWVILTLLMAFSAYLTSTAGLAWRDTTLSDPGKYGPTHGNIITVALGGGDSTSQPSKLIAMNNGGRVEIIELLANDPSKAQILRGPDLVTQNFPDPTNAEVDLSAGNGFVRVTIYGSYYDAPFHRCQTGYTLVEDGQGNLKQQQ